MIYIIVMDTLLTTIYNEVKNIEGGKVADYIPQLGKVDPSMFGIAICTVDGEFLQIGDSDKSFCLQSCSKPYSYCVARELVGSEKVHSHVGYEPSGQSFNAFVLNDQGLPHNPLINAGAIMVASLIGKNDEPANRFDILNKYYNRLCGNGDVVGFDNSVFLSEKQHADRNISLAYYMRENKAFDDNISPHEINEALDLYFQACSVQITCKFGAIMCSTLANGGTCPINNDPIFQTNTVRDCLSLMYGCGMYDFSGQFAFEMGLPAKSSVSGCIMLVIPNRFGICIWSPSLNKQGNSVKGIEVCRLLVKNIKCHIFHNIVDNDHDKCVILQKAIEAASDGNLTLLKKFKDKTDLSKGDYDKRTPLHLAAAEGHLDVVKYLIDQGINVNSKDRWEHTALDEAKHNKHHDIVDLLENTIK